MHCSVHLDIAEMAWYKHTKTSNTTIEWAVNIPGKNVSADITAMSLHNVFIWDINSVLKLSCIGSQFEHTIINHRNIKRKAIRQHSLGIVSTFS